MMDEECTSRTRTGAFWICSISAFMVSIEWVRFSTLDVTICRLDSAAYGTVEDDTLSPWQSAVRTIKAEQITQNAIVVLVLTIQPRIVRREEVFADPPLSVFFLIVGRAAT